MANKDPNYAAFADKPGNLQVLGMVDFGWYSVSIFYRTWILLNRNYSNVYDGKVHWLHGVNLGRLEFVKGSSKMGIELRHPHWTITWTSYTSPVTQNSRFLRVDYAKTAPHPELSQLTIAWLSPNGLPGDPNGRPLGPPYIPRGNPFHSPIVTS